MKKWKNKTQMELEFGEGEKTGENNHQSVTFSRFQE
jgi:hypothetical protein